MTVKERILKVITAKKIAVSTFEAKCGLSNGYIKNIKGSPGMNKIEDILSAFPEINRIWLLTGEGEMHQTGKKIEEISPSEINIEKILDIMQKQADSLERRDNQIDELIAMLKKGNAHADEDVRCAAANE